MSNINTTIRKVYQQISRQGLGISSSKAYEHAKKYINSLSEEDREILEEKGLEGYQSGDAFVQKIVESIKENIDADEAKNIDDTSLFSVSMDKVSKMDLSQDAIDKALNDNQDITQAIQDEQDAQEAQNDQDGQVSTDGSNDASIPQSDEEKMFMQFLQAMYNDELMKSILDADGDNKISNEEAQNFIKNMNINGDKNNFTIGDVSDFFNKANGLLTEAEEWEKLEKESIEKGQGPADLPQNKSGISSNPYSPSYGSYTPSYGSDGKVTGGTQSGSMTPKEDLQEQIDEYKQQISDVNNGSDEEIQGMTEQAEASKEKMNEAIENDEKLTEEQKEQATELMEKLSEVDSQIADIDTQIASLQQELSAGEATLSSLESSMSSIPSAPASTGDAQADKQVQEQIEARKQELQSQIDEQKTKNEQLEEQIAQLEEQKATLEEQKATIEQGGEENQMSLEELKETASEQTVAAMDAYQEQTQQLNERKVEKVEEITENLNVAQQQLQEIETQENQAKDEQCQMTTNATFEEMLGFVLGVEGGLSNDPDDNGGLTNLGITQSTYSNWLKNQGMGDKSVENITVEEARQIYYTDYFVASGAENYLKEGNVAYAYALFDASVNHGTEGAKSLDRKAQGDLEAFMQARVELYKNIIANKPSQAKFRNGWQNRVNKLAKAVGLNITYTI